MSVHDENLASLSELKVQSSPYRPYGLKIKRNLGYISDEMNIFVPQSIQAQIELEQIADVKYQIMTPQSSAPIISIKEDALVGSFNMTGNELTLDWRTAMNILSATKLKNYNVIPKDKTISGKAVYSTIIPKKINMYKGDGETAIISVKNGEILDGRIVDAAIGAKKKNNLIQLVLDEYGVEEAVTFLDNITRLVNNFNLYYGMTVGIGDLDIGYDLYKKMYQVFKTKKLEVNHEITEVENNPDMMDEELFEITIKQKLDIIRDDIGKLIFNNLKPNNNMKIMNECGSKGSILNIGQMGGCVGNQDFQGDRMPKNYNERTLPYFFKNDDSAEARGFIEGSFLNGLNLSEFIFHHVTGREGLIDQALKSVTPDTEIVIKRNKKLELICIGVFVDELIKKNNITKTINTDEYKNMEICELNEEILIPSIDENGNSYWLPIINVTRHDPTNMLFEVKTKNGRSVKVPETKSLLIYDEFTCQLHEKNTLDIKIGDKLPIINELIDDMKVLQDYEYQYIKGQIYDYKTISELLFDNFKLNTHGIQTFIDEQNKSLTIIHNNNSLNDVVLDEVIEINEIPNVYSKLYDLTIPETSNFVLANGLGVRDTASSGYLQRKFIKATEDFMVKYDGTVRNAVERIQQFIYGDSGIDTVKQYDYKFKIMEMNNAEVAEKFKFSKEELKNVKNFSEANNDAFYKEILAMRDHLRQSQLKATMNYLALNTNYMLPVNINRIIDNAKNSNNKDPVLNEPDYIIKLIDNILLPDKSRLYSMTEEEMKNEKSPKYIDDKISKTAFKYALYETLAPKKCIHVYKLSKKQLDNISEQIIISFNRSVVEPGEMVGILGAQSLGEPVTQMVLNSVDWKEEILVRDTKTNEDLVIPIGKFIDEQIENEKDKVVSMGDNLENNMKGIYYLDTKSKNYYIQSVNEDGKISWKKIEAITKHLPINKDGSNTLIKVTTRMGKSVIATKGKSFLTQRDNKVVPIRGDEIKVGDYLPIMKNYCNDYAFDELDITGYFPKDKYIYGSEIAKAKALRNKNLAEGNREWFKCYIGKDFTVPYARQDSLKNVIDKNFDYRVNCIYPKQSHVDTHIPEKIKLDNDFGFLIGAYLAEGCITKTQISISNNDKAYRDRIAKFCDKYNIGYHETCRPKENVQMATQDGYDIRIHSMMLVEVIQNTCSKYSYNKYVPSFAFNSNCEFIKGLIDGYISGDGTVRHKGRAKYISATSVSKKLLVGISTLLTKFGIVSKLSTNKLQESNNLNSKVIHQSHSLTIRNNNIIKFGENIELTESNKNKLVKDICKTEFKFDNGYYDIYPSVKLESNKNTTFRRDKLIDLSNTDISKNDKKIINTIVNNDVFFDKIISIEEVEPSNTYVYDFTIEETQNFIMADGLCVRDSFHNTGIGGVGGANLGVPRMQEVFSLSKNMKAPFMMVYLDKEHREKKDFANKIASYIKFTTIRDLRTNIEIYYDPKPYNKDGFMEKDNVYNIFYAFQQSKSCCLNKIDGLPWLMRIEFDKEKLMNKEVSLLDIKSRFCTEWEKRFQDLKALKREKRQILEKITQLAILTNTDNDSTPTMHIRFDMTNFNSSTLIDFMDMFVDEFKLKGMPNIEDIAGGNATEERIISFDNSEGLFEKNKNEYIIYTKGINMTAIRDIIGVDLTRTYCNDIITTYEMFGIEAARNLIIREVTAVFAANGSAVNHQHVSIFGDLMTNVGSLTSIDRHGLNKLETDPLARASFEKTVEQLITAAVFNEVDHMNSVSSRIMAGLCIKGGTGLCNLILDRELLENSEYTIDIGQLYKKTYDDIIPVQPKQEIDTDVFIPDF